MIMCYDIWHTYDGGETIDNLLIQANSTNIPLADESVQCVVTSPPYYGLRDYGVDGQIGIEQTPDGYVRKLVDVFREVKRVLRDDGSLWLNLGDSYSGSGKGRNADGTAGGSGVINKANMGTQVGTLYKTNDVDGLKPKDLIGIPWRVAFALQADGWYLRQDIIWAKPNPMPESVKDRCTKSHEYIFLLTKNARYYYDSDAIKEPSKYAGDDRGSRTDSRRTVPLANSMNGKTGEFRNKRDVWTVTTKPYKGAHYATFPPDLITPCILAGCPEGGIVFDPFAGSGTTVMVANRLGRKGVGLDLSWKYLDENARKRVAENK